MFYQGFLFKNGTITWLSPVTGTDNSQAIPGDEQTFQLMPPS